MKTNNFKKIVKSPTVLNVNEETELMTFLIDNLPKKNKNNIKSLLVHRQIWVNNKPITQYNYLLEPGKTVTINWNKVRVEENYKGVKILFEDKDIIVIQKQAGLLSIASDKEQEKTAYNILKEHVKNEHPTNKIFVVHRLDRETSGVMMFAKTPEMQQTLQTSWKKIVQERKYVAVVEGSIKHEKDTIVSWLKENNAFVMYSSPVDNGGKKAVTNYNVLKKNKTHSLVELNIDTGRKNQIRIHMKDLGHSIIGDKKYGATTNPINRLGLHALVLAFKHPTTDELLRFETRVPVKFTNLFSNHNSKQKIIKKKKKKK